MLHHGLWGAVLHQHSLWFPCYFFILYFFLLNIPSFPMLPFLVFLSFKVDWNKLFFFSHTCAEEIKSSHLFIYYIFSCLIMIFLLFLNSLPFCNAFVFLLTSFRPFRSGMPTYLWQRARAKCTLSSPTCQGSTTCTASALLLSCASSRGLSRPRR